MGKSQLVLITLILPALLSAQGFTNWFVGNTTNAVVQAQGGSCLMGGATENDNAMRWFLQRANGGDVLVLRASGSDGYQNYFHSQLGVAVNSVETIRFDDASAADAAYVHQRIQGAEAIWFAGGDQWNYVNFWRGTAIDSLVNIAVTQRNAVIGGTSAGMAIMGGAYFTAQFGSVTSPQALSDPFHPNITVSQEPFLRVPFLSEVVTDSHYDDPDRRGRHMVFLARAAAGSGVDVKGIACNEYTSVCIDQNGIARVFGEWPNYPERAFFLQADCMMPEGPETMQAGVPLTWFREGVAVKVYNVPGTMEGEYTFDLNDWLTGSGGAWENWTVQQGSFSATPGGPAPDCISTAIAERTDNTGKLVWDVRSMEYVLTGIANIRSFRLFDALGRELPVVAERTDDGLRIPAAALPLGILILSVEHGQGLGAWRIMRP